jgi:hypothetical protein
LLREPDPDHGEPGVDDRRLLIHEPEFASILRGMQRQGSTQSAMLRGAWDRDHFSNVVKTNAARGWGIVSIVAHVTGAEARKYLDRTELANGFANRFLWLSVRSSKLLPFGSDVDEVKFRALADRVREALRRAKALGELHWSAEARELYGKVYPDLRGDDREGMFGEVTSRAAPQVVRLAVAYAALDGSPTIEAAHLRAALAVWRRCQGSAAFLFEGPASEPPEVAARRELVEWIERQGGTVALTRALTHAPRAVRPPNMQAAERLFGELEQAGYGRLAYLPTHARGGRPQRVFHLGRTGSGSATVIRDPENRPNAAAATTATDADADTGPPADDGAGPPSPSYNGRAKAPTLPLPACVADLSPEDRERFEERAAIREIDGGMDRAEAERLTWHEMFPGDDRANDPG